ncbi:MFS transporter [Micromonospora sp. NPDC006766]|uniref:MFS transporter n=1 Tax=Micromonospora sp. NPDC006766 TaxID=3154778 RepID=UPI00340FDCB5
MSTMAETPTEVQTAKPLRWLFASTGISVTGDGMLLTAAPLMAAALSRDPLSVASVTAAGYAAWLFAGLPAGALVDRWSRRLVMVLADLLRAAVLTVFAGLALFDIATIPTLVLVVLLVGVGSCFFDPAAQALVPQLVGRDKDRLGQVNGRFWAIDTFGRSLAGPPLGAAAFSASRALPFGVDAFSFLASAALLSRLPNTPRKPSTQPILPAIREGVAYLIRQAELRTVTFGMAFYNLGYNLAFATLVLFAQDKLSISTFAYGVLVAAMSVGGIIGGWIGPRVGARLTPGHAYALTLSVQGLAWLAAVFSGHVWLVGLSLVFVGVASTTGSVVGGSTRHLHSPDELLGRVVAATRLLGIGSAAVGALLGGLVANAAGLAAPFYVAASFLLVSAAAFLRLGRPRH